MESAESSVSSSNNDESSRSSSDEDLLGKGDLIGERNLLNGKDIFAEFGEFSCVRNGFLKDGRKSFDKVYRTKTKFNSSLNCKQNNKKQDLHCETSSTLRQYPNIGPQSAPALNKNVFITEPRSAIKITKS